MTPGPVEQGVTAVVEVVEVPVVAVGAPAAREVPRGSGGH